MPGPSAPSGREHDPAPDLYKDQKGLPQPPYVPGLEVAGTVRALGDGVEGLRVGEPVVTLSGTGVEGGYAFIAVGVVAAALGLTAYPWQVAHPTPTLAELHAKNPRWGHAALDFEPRLTRLL
ncbi:alcohol dehydrogenase catalytic domain-containing protein [Streptomyces antibioticus]|uniref:alcohol dehydrogenase catalytic domain-containing protein n=1 Tax=Streptomyces antibioticus TaxID=1890 RepID=UPI0037AF3B66